MLHAINIAESMKRHHIRSLYFNPKFLYIQLT